ncbi:CoA ester lyase [Rhodococcus sp. 14C212]|uniref:HpcH/HpaI aldolase/citrate lyase family protein n=1 Tax=Rhodococcus sp. 14C212 TaxID=2711209 RepID=UPI0013EDC99A|nr:CoA ester lyase [Rhodococcus sp. 14C212]NGP07767.1 CoA ester lyase [Rhodococcus sp. 14C212]
MRPYRSMLFVPGHKGSWADKAVATGTDAIILDLEDSVPASDKELARKTVVESISRLHDQGIRADVWVRPNSRVTGLMGADLDAVVVPGVAGLLLPKTFDAKDIIQIDAVVSHLEETRNLPAGEIGLLLSLETASSMANCEDMAAAVPRVASLLGATGPNADVGRELGFEFTPEGLETLYLRSRIVLACRANGLHHPIGGVWQAIKDLDGFRTFAEDNRRLGYRGMALIHPSHVEITNEVFTPSPEKVEFYRRMVQAFRDAEAQGHGAVDFEGQHIDLAHAKTAEGVIALAEAVSAV